MLPPLSTQIVGSYTKPQWLVRHDHAFRVDGSAWRVEDEYLDEARHDAALLAILDQERAGLDVVTDGEAQRPAYDHHFYARLDGVDAVHLQRRQPQPLEVSTSIVDTDRQAELDERRTRVPRIVSELRWSKPLSVDEFRLLKANASRKVKSTVIGPLSSAGKLADEYYHDEGAVIMALADALNHELAALDKESIDLLQIDEPGFHSGLSIARRYGLEALERMTSGIRSPIAVHICYGYAYFRSMKSPSATYAEALELLASSDRIAAISLEYEQPANQPDILRHCGDKHVILGLLNLGTHVVETPDHIAGRLRAALQVVPAERLHPSSDCGMWHLPRVVAFQKIKALVDGTNIVRRELGLTPRKNGDDQ